MPPSKTCTGCGETKALDLFTKVRRKSDGRGSRCKACCAAFQNARYHAKRGKGRAEKSAAKRALVAQARSKQCNQCLETKPFDDFYKDSTCIDGRFGKCKPCRAAYAKAQRLADPDKFRARGARNRAAATAEQKTRYRLAKNAKRKAVTAARDRKKRAISPHRMKVSANDAVKKALKSGRITRKPCEVCGVEQRIHAHHDDYSKPLDVRWLCRKHHDEWHAEDRRKRAEALGTTRRRGLTPPTVESIYRSGRRRGLSSAEILPLLEPLGPT